MNINTYLVFVFSRSLFAKAASLQNSLEKPFKNVFVCLFTVENIQLLFLFM